ncbi:MAG: hypothetical protein B7Z66_11750 [Chromatiales bacterium 21-64-14]|nr:MAG: hypothetical protein B7Z66_11750 [Chromatiales bacterium 21-64-14]
MKASQDAGAFVERVAPAALPVFEVEVAADKRRIRLFDISQQDDVLMEFVECSHLCHIGILLRWI